jgi:uncharacterized membrane protein
MSAKNDHRSARTYLTTVVLLLVVLPVACVLLEASRGASDLPVLIGKWFVFWGIGVRLFLAGLRQMFQPAFTAATIFEISDTGAHAIVRELGFANVAMGTLGLASLADGAWLAPSALVGGLYYGLAGIGHIARQRRNVIEQTALISDLLIFALLAILLASRAFR